LTGAFSGLEDTPTGEFLASQSSLNIALGLIMVFTMALAGAIKKKKKDDTSGGRGGSRSVSRNGGGRGAGGAGRQVNIQRPKVAPSSEEPQVMSPDDDIDEIAEAMTEKDEQGAIDTDNVDEVEISHQEPEVETPGEEGNEEMEDEDDEESEGDFKCDTCGENFDTESGLKLHREALH
jgi:hypothetical protein